MLEPGNKKGVAAWAARAGAKLNLIPYCPSFDCAIEVGEPIECRFSLSLAMYVPLWARPEFFGCDFLGASPKTVGDVLPGQAHLVTVSVDAVKDDVGVGMVGVEMVDGDPLEALTQVAFDTHHEAADVEVEVDLAGVFGRDDETKLVSLMRSR
jgi:hypothetical protein